MGRNAGAGFDLFEHGGGLALVGAAVGDADADDGASGVRGGGELDVESRAEATIGHLHDAGVGISGGHARGRVLGAALLLDRGDVGELGECRLEPREPFLGDARHRRGVAGRERGVGRRAGDLDEVGAGFRHEPLEGLTASKRRSAGGGADAGAVLGDAMEIDEVVFHEPRQELGHELAEDVAVVAAEIVEAVIGDCDAAAQPAVGGVELDEPRDLATRADAVTGGIDPEPQEDLRVGRGCAGDLTAGADVGVPPAQIELVDDGGDRTHLVIGGHRGVEVDPPPGDLAALRALDPHVAFRLHRAARPGRPGGFVNGTGPQRGLGP